MFILRIDPFRLDTWGLGLQGFNNKWFNSNRDFNRIDTNRSGQLSLNEIYNDFYKTKNYSSGILSNRGIFSMFDRNNDRKLDRFEYANARNIIYS